MCGCLSGGIRIVTQCHESWPGLRSDMQVITPHHQAHILQSLRPAGEGTAYTATMWALRNIEKTNEHHKQKFAAINNANQSISHSSD